MHPLKTVGPRDRAHGTAGADHHAWRSTRPVPSAPSPVVPPPPTCSATHSHRVPIATKRSRIIHATRTSQAQEGETGEIRRVVRVLARTQPHRPWRGARRWGQNISGIWIDRSIGAASTTYFALRITARNTPRCFSPWHGKAPAPPRHACGPPPHTTYTHTMHGLHLQIKPSPGGSKHLPLVKSSTTVLFPPSPIFLWMGAWDITLYYNLIL